MIINHLSKLYDRLDKENTLGLPKLGFSIAKVAYALVLDKDGKLVAVENLQVKGDKKAKLFNREILVPQQVKKNGDAIDSSFLCDRTDYCLGRKDDDNPKYQLRFEGFKKEQHRLGDNIDEIEMQAVLKFLDAWQPANLEQTPLLWEQWQDICKSNGDLVFKVEVNGATTSFVHDNPKIRERFMYDLRSKDSAMGFCLASGNSNVPIARLHEKIKGVADGQSSGTSLVSYNWQSFESYGKEQGDNAPISSQIAFKYAASLNHLLSNYNKKFMLGGVTTVFWCEEANPIEGVFGEIANPTENYEKNLKIYFDSLKKGRNNPDKHLNDLQKDKLPFYILGLNPNGGRIGVSLFIQSTPLAIGQNLLEHYENMAIDSYKRDEDKEKTKYIPFWQLNKVLKSEKAKDVPTSLTLALYKSIFMGSNYPHSILIRLLQTIKSDQNIRYERASLLKAILIKNYNQQELKMSLDKNITNDGYLLGRLFAMLEKAQEVAINANASIADRYMSSAASTPHIVFPTIMRLSRHHLSKIGGGLAHNIEKEIMEIFAIYSNQNGFPKKLSMQDQGLFFIGYYQEKIALVDILKSKKEDEGENE